MGLEGLGLPVDEVAGRRRVPGARRCWRCSTPGGRAAAARSRRWSRSLPRGSPALLLVWDLRQPQRFLWTLTRPQWRSWLVRGVVHHRGLRRCCSALHVCCGCLRLGRCRALLAGAHRRCWPPATAVYTAFLFGQAKGRDLWQSPLLAPHLIVQALPAGAALFAARRGCSGCCPSTACWWRPRSAAATRPRTRAARRGSSRTTRASRPACWPSGHLLPLALLWASARRSAALAGAPGPVRPAASGSTSTCRRRSRSRSHDAIERAIELPGSGLQAYPPAEKWDDWREYDADAVAAARRAALHARADDLLQLRGRLRAARLRRQGDAARSASSRATRSIPASRGRNCAKGPATINQINDPERILYPLKRGGPRGAGKWERVTLGRGARRRSAGASARRSSRAAGTRSCTTSAGPGHDGYMDRVLQGLGRSTATTPTPTSARRRRALGYALWSGYDRPCPDHANARFILLLSSHLEAGHYFNPHAQRIIEGKLAGAKLAVIDPRLSNTASHGRLLAADLAGHRGRGAAGDGAACCSTRAWPTASSSSAGSTGASTWPTAHPGAEPTFAALRGRAARRTTREFTPEFAEAESGVPARPDRRRSRGRSARARGALRVARLARRGQRQPRRLAGRARLQFLTVLTGERRARAGGTSPARLEQVQARRSGKAAAARRSGTSCSSRASGRSATTRCRFLLPHFLKEGRGKLDAYFTRVYNPVWTNPDGLTVDRGRCSDESLVGLHAALTPTWSETASSPTTCCHGPRRRAPRHPEPGDAAGALDRASASRCCARRASAWARPFELHLRGQPRRGLGGGRVLDRALAGASTPTARSASASYFESPYRPGEKLTVDEYYRWIFENSVPGPARGRRRARA